MGLVLLEGAAFHLRLDKQLLFFFCFQYYIELNDPFVLMNEEMQNNNDYLTMEGKNRDSNYLNMRGSTNSESNPGIDDQTGHYDNIGSVRPVGVAKGEEVILKPPMEVVPMIQFSDEGVESAVKLTSYSSNDKELSKASPRKAKQDFGDGNITHHLTDYIYMGSPKKKEFTDHPFTVTAKPKICGGSGFRDTSEKPPSYKSVISNIDNVAV